MPETSRLVAQMGFLDEADALKEVIRSNVIQSGVRRENTAEHSWHVALYALIHGPFFAPNCDIDRVIAMLLMHDIVEIDAGDHPVHLASDPTAVAKAEAACASRLFGALPDDQAENLHALRDEFEACKTPEAQVARLCDIAQPVMQEAFAEQHGLSDLGIVRSVLETGRASILRASWPDAYGHALSALNETLSPAMPDFQARQSFLNEACALKGVNRATYLHSGARQENSGEHSWHIALYAFILSEHAHKPVNAARVVRMLLLHDLVEIDAGDAPIHGDHDPAAQEALEQAAADRLFGLLPQDQSRDLRALWEEFEAAQSDDAQFAKSIDRVQPLAANMANGGGSWVEYDVTYEQLVARVGAKIERGAPEVWRHVNDRIQAFDWFAAQLAKTEAR